MNQAKKPLYRQENSVRKSTVIILFSVIFIALSFWVLQDEWNASVPNYVHGLCIFYAFLSTLFLLAQVIAFVWSQSTYVDEIENEKFRILDLEK